MTMSDTKARVIAAIRARRKKRRQSPDFIPPRYDDVYFAGVQALDADDEPHRMADYVATLRIIGRPATRFDVRAWRYVAARMAGGEVPPSPAAVGAALDQLAADGAVTREDRGHGVVLYSVKP